MKVISQRYLDTWTGCGDEHHHGYALHTKTNQLIIHCGMDEAIAGDCFHVDLQTGIGRHQLNSEEKTMSPSDLKTLQAYCKEMRKRYATVVVERCDEYKCADDCSRTERNENDEILVDVQPDACVHYYRFENTLNIEETVGEKIKSYY